MTPRGARSRGLWPLALATSALVLLAPAAPAAGPAYRGVHVHGLLTDDTATMKRELDAARGLGSNVVRVDVVWGAFEPGARGRPEPMYRARVDRFMNALSARGLKAIAMIHQTPCWAPGGSSTECLLLGPTTGRPPRDARDYGRFVRYFTGRYRRKLAAIEVWNEPNNGFFFQSDDRPRDYTKLVKAAYPQVKAVAPEVKVLAGAMSGADADFLRGLYHYRIRGSYDAISVHPYMGDGSDPPDAPAPTGDERAAFLSGLRLIRRTQLAAGDRTPVWATEFGWNTGAYRNVSLAPWLNGVSPPTQASYLARALELLNGSTTGLGFVQGATIYNLRDTDAAPFALRNFGVLRNDLSRKPSYEAVRRGFATIARTRAEERYSALNRRP